MLPGPGKGAGTPDQRIRSAATGGEQPPRFGEIRSFSEWCPAPGFPPFPMMTLDPGFPGAP